MATTLPTLSYNRADRWSDANLKIFREGKRLKSDATIRKHVSILEKVAADNGGLLPPFKWLERNGYFTPYQTMLDYPAAFAHIRRDTERKYQFETAQAHDEALSRATKAMAKPVILPPTQPKSIAEYDVPGAHFNPTELVLDAGLTEGEWMQVGRAIAHVCQSAHWWVGDFLQYGFRQYGKRNAFDLAQQATGYSRSALHGCAYLSKRFPPTQRAAALTWFHHKCIAGFPNEIANRLLREAVELGLTGRQLKEIGDELIGKKKKKKNRRKIVVYLWSEQYEELETYMPLNGKAGVFVGQIVSQWLTNEALKREKENGPTVAAS